MSEEQKVKEAIRKYFKEIRRIYLTGDYTEFTYRTAFENFITDLNKDFKLRQEPKRVTGLGAPDFKAFLGERKVGYIETKDLGKDLDEIINSEQLKKYRDNIDNLILTNYLRFVLIRKGQKVYDLTLFSLSELNKGKLTLSEDKINSFTSLLNEFFEYKLPTIKSAEELALELSNKAKLLKELALVQLLEDLKKVKNGDEQGTSSIYDFYQSLRELIKDINTEDGADAYAQTVTYGLFLARKNSPTALDRISASSYIPKNVGIIKRIFLNISGVEFPSNVAWVVDDIIDILNASEIESILAEIDKRGKKDKDPIIFFYEDFLNHYEPEKKKHLGVYYTPRPVVNYIVKSIHSVLKINFERKLGLADNGVNVLDPAIGTGTFFWIAFLLVLGELKNRGLSALIQDTIENHLLKHFYGFEILITPYVISHLKLGDVLHSWGYKFKDNDRIQVYLTNTLEPSEVHGLIPFLKELTEETRIANQIKLKKKILVIMGNPPYAGMSANKGEWINKLLKEGYSFDNGISDDGYYRVDGKPLGEKNPKWLQDDYVKFIRYAQWKIDQNGEGIVGFITNHGYLDNPTFRGMRESLLRSFNRIYILNLHGNVKKKERAPDGSKDENVFDIQQGVAIGIFIKNPNLEGRKVYYKDLWGTREKKYEWLDKHSIYKTDEPWQEIAPRSPFYFFVPKDSELEEDYEKFWKITEIFPVNGVGMTTARDNFVIDFDKEILLERIKKFKDSVGYSDEDLHSIFKIRKKKGWSIRKAWNMLQQIPDDNMVEYIRPVLYRPFDKRWIFYHDSVVWRTARRVMQHMLKENLGLITVRQVAEGIFNHAYIADTIVESRITLSNKGIGYIFPLYLYTDSGKRVNFSKEFLEFVREKYGDVSPEDVLFYIYAVLYSPTYRKRYEEFLRYDFPRIPFVDDFEKFKKLAEIGKELVELHLMKKELPSTVKFDIPGSNVVEKVKYKDGRVWINNEQYFEPVPREIWDFYIGGYQVLDKWLKSRKGRKLNTDEVLQFIQIVEIIRETIRLMGEIDKIDIFA